MFGLRIQHSETGAETNQDLGNLYMLLKRGDANWKKKNNFLRELDKMGLENHHKVIAIVSDENGKMTPLFQQDNHYIVTERGNTYERI